MFYYRYIIKIEHFLHGIRFEWDRRKSESNLKKHRILFENACEVFFDPFLHTMEPEIQNGERREAIIGMTLNWRLLYVAYTMLDNDVLRIISARPVTKQERKQYENE